MDRTTPTGARVCDRRVVRTREAIARAFRTLLKATDYDRVTVSAIAREADINRKTFYLHYSSVDDLLEDLLTQGVSRVVGKVGDEYGWTLDRPMQVALSTAILQEAAQSPGSETNLLRCVPIDRSLAMLCRPLTALIVAKRHEQGLPVGPYLDYHVSCYLGALFGAFMVWESHGCVEPLDEVADIVHRMVAVDVEKLFGQPDPTS